MQGNQPPQGPHGYGPPPPPPGPMMQQYGQQPPAVYIQNSNVMQKAPFNHKIHVVLDVCTCGGWVPIHLICWALH